MKKKYMMYNNIVNSNLFCYFDWTHQWILIIILITFRSSHQRCSLRKGIFGNFTKFTGKQMCQNFFFNKVGGMWPAILLKKRLWHWCFPMNFANFLRIAFLQNTSERLLQNIYNLIKHVLLLLLPSYSNRAQWTY